MAKVVREGIGNFCHHYPKIAAVITAQSGGKRNAMTAAWHTSLSVAPPLYAVSISTKRFTYRMIADSGQFGVNFLPFAAAELIASIGANSGSSMDKFRQFRIKTEEPVKTSVPILKAAYCTYECKLIDDREYGDHRLMVGRIVAVHFLKGAFTSEEVLDLDRFGPALYMGHELYITAAKEPMKHLEREIYRKKEEL